MTLKRNFLLGSSVLMGFTALLATPASAQTSPTPASDAAASEEVVVTGSRIRRDPTTAPTPLIQLGREEVLSSGEPNVVDFLADIPALSGSQVPEDTTGAVLNTGGLSLLNLRQLGSVRTLVLVDGRRHVGSSPGSLSVDVDTIPAPLIQSVEVVTGGQSALYGADAVSGVVNFILRKDFDGIEIDGAYSQINQEGQSNRRVSALVGKNFFDDRLNVYGFAEYQENDEVLDSDVEFRRRAFTLLNNDSDVNNATPDNQRDNILIAGARTLSRGTAQQYGTLILANQVAPSPNPADPDIPFQRCAPPPATPFFTGNFNGGAGANCFAVDPNQPNKFFVFSGAGTPRTPNFGTFQDQNGYTRPVNIGGDGLNLGTEFSQASRIPAQDAQRFQAGMNFELTDNLSAFAEVKYVKENSFAESQSTFFDAQISAVQAGTLPSINGTTSFNIGTDNAYLDPTVRNAILNNTRPQYTTAGVPGPAVADPRAVYLLFGPDRFQNNSREVTRYVAGLRGESDTFGPLENFSWEAAFTYGKMQNTNIEAAVDVERYAFAADAVRDTANVTGKGANSIVCRVQLLAAQGAALPDRLAGFGIAGRTATLSPTSNQVQQCQPFNIFGGGPTGAALDYVSASIKVEDYNEQSNFLLTGTGDLWDLWGAGEIGVAFGYEYREERTRGVGRSASTGSRLLFLNTGPDFPEANYDVNEVFGEINIPLLRDLPFAQRVEMSAAYRTSEYSTVGEVETYSFQGQWRVNPDVLFRGTFGTAVRIPNLGENFRPATQTFGNGLVDPCDAGAIEAQTTEIQANRRANCALLLGAGYNPAPVTAGGTRILYTSGVPGFNSGNPFLQPEESRSYTMSVVLTPRFIPNLSMVFDYYDISITNVISAVTVQQALNQCVNGPAPNTGACATFTRNGNFTTPGVTAPPFGVNSFIQGSINFAATEARGIDFNLRYNYDLTDLFDRDLGRLRYSLRGNYLISQRDAFSVANPDAFFENASYINFPRYRFLSTLTWEPTSKLAISWDWDMQADQQIDDEELLIINTDVYDPRYQTTGSFHQHDFTVRWEPREDLTLRAGVVNAFAAEPARWLGSTTSADNFDLFGRRLFVGFTYRR